MYVIGTAGHVDHGKSTLVKALTGIDPDRLKEEQQRAMTIDLGFAWLTLPGGEEVGVVDVPGHERLVKNMLAGVGGIDLALLVIAADEGVMPQTREHLDILDLLRLQRGVVAITKKDLVDEDWLELVMSEARDTLAATRLAEAPMVAVSAVSGEGLEELKRVLADALARTEPRQDLGRPRLNIDRAFVMPGFGPVVTGTLVDGTLRVGQEVEIVPRGLRGRIRGLQTHRRKIEVATPGRRLAVNLNGVDLSALRRGEVLASPGWLAPTIALDARVQVVPRAPGPLRHNAPVTLHVGTSETPARLRLLEADELAPGQSGWAQLRLERPVAVVKGDLFILRNSWGTVGGGEVVEPQAKRHQRRHPATLVRLEVLAAGTPAEVVLDALAAREPCQAGALVAAANRPWEEVRAALGELDAQGRVVRLGGDGIDERTLLYSAAGYERARQRLRDALAEHHRRFPLRRGMLREEARTRLNLPAPAFGALVGRLAAEGAVVEDGAALRLPGHTVTLSPAQRAEADAYLRRLASSPFSPPGDVRIDPELLNHLVESGRVVRCSPEVVFTAEAYREMVERVVGRIRERGSITLAEVRDLLGTSRKYVQPLLEHLDEQRVTRRVGDERVLR